MSKPIKSVNFGFNPVLTDQFQYAGECFIIQNGRDLTEVNLVNIAASMSGKDNSVTCNADVVYLGDPQHIAINPEWKAEQLLLGLTTTPLELEGNFKLHVAHRPDKLIQAMIIRRIGIRLGIKDILSPLTWGNTTANVKALDFSKHTKLMMKCGNGARGMGQVLFDTRNIQPYQLVQWLALEEKDFIAKVNENHGVVTGSQFAGDDIMSELRESYHFQAMVPDITHEYRVLAFGDKMYYIERKRNGKEYVQARGTVGVSSIPTEIVDGNAGRGGPINDDIQAVIKELLKLTPIISVDVYSDVNGKQGIFEYSNQFAMDHLDHTWRVNFMRHAILSLI